MTDYDRGGFVSAQTLTIEPCANGTYLIHRKSRVDGQYTAAPLIENTVAFSSAQHMLDFLQSEYGNPETGHPFEKPENPDDPRPTRHCTCWACNQPADRPHP